LCERRKRALAKRKKIFGQIKARPMDGRSMRGKSLETTNRLMVVGAGAILLRTGFALDIGSLLESIPATGISM
jgi:hypothetical protein